MTEYIHRVWAHGKEYFAHLGQSLLSKQVARFWTYQRLYLQHSHVVWYIVYTIYSSRVESGAKPLSLYRRCVYRNSCVYLIRAIRARCLSAHELYHMGFSHYIISTVPRVTYSEFAWIISYYFSRNHLETKIHNEIIFHSYIRAKCPYPKMLIGG